MPKITMEARGKFSQIMAAAVEKKNMSLRDLAANLDYTYEQMRKIWQGHSVPSKLLLKAFIKELDLDPKEAEQAVTSDRMNRTYGKGAYTALGQNPRIADIVDILPQLSDQEWDMFVGQLRGFVHQKRTTKSKPVSRA